MRNTKNSAFTLVELIVVITILAILGTIAFISLQGYSQDAKNSKVTSDLRNLVSAIGIEQTKNSTTFAEMITGTAGHKIDDTNGKVGSGQSIDNYDLGNVNFAAIQQNGDDFKDPNGPTKTTEYLYAFVKANGSGTLDPYSGYQVAGEIIDKGTTKVSINGNYYQKATGSTDVAGLISDSTTSNTGGLINNQSLDTGASIY